MIGNEIPRFLFSRKEDKKKASIKIEAF